MEVWSVHHCPMCQGFGVNAKKVQYVAWRRVLIMAKDEIVKRNKPVVIFQIAHQKIEEAMKLFPPCSWCGGLGYHTKKETDVDLDGPAS